MIVLVAQTCLTLQPHELQPTKLLCPWSSLGKNTGLGCHSLLQGIFPAQGSNLGLLHCRRILYHLSHKGNLTSFIGKISKEMIQMNLLIKQNETDLDNELMIARGKDGEQG